MSTTKGRSVLHTPEKSGFPSAVRGAGPVGTALRRPCPAAGMVVNRIAAKPVATVREKARCVLTTQKHTTSGPARQLDTRTLSELAGSISNGRENRLRKGGKRHESSEALSGAGAEIHFRSDRTCNAGRPNRSASRTRGRSDIGPDALCWSPDGKRIAIAYEGEGIELWDPLIDDLVPPIRGLPDFSVTPGCGEILVNETSKQARSQLRRIGPMDPSVLALPYKAGSDEVSPVVNVLRDVDGSRRSTI
jgi:hypothetical protein